MKKRISMILCIVIIVVISVIVVNNKKYVFVEDFECNVSIGLNEYMNLCIAPKEELQMHTLLKDELLKYNAENENSVYKVEDVMEIVQFFSDTYYDGCIYEKPYLVRHNKNTNIWVVQGNDKNLLKNNIYGGVIYVVIDGKSGDVLYVAHTV